MTAPKPNPDAITRAEPAQLLQLSEMRVADLRRDGLQQRKISDRLSLTRWNR